MFRDDCEITPRRDIIIDEGGYWLRAEMTASRLYHRERVIPAQTDYLEDKGGVIGLSYMLFLCGSRQSAT